jgi:rhodanese-related sulfurtransferase
VTPQELAVQSETVQVLDVREPYEWAAGHIADADHIPMGHLNARVAELARDRLIVCVCRSGHRSQAVTDALNRAGFDAANLEGGMLAWLAAGLPAESADGQQARVV